MPDGGLRLAMVGVLSFLGAVALVPLVRRIALRYGLSDHPSHGKIHTESTPYLGGVAIAFVALAVSMLLPQWTPEAAAIVVGAVVVGAVGLLDDLYTVGPIPRVAVEVAAALGVYAFGTRVHLVGGGVDVVLTVVWLVVVTNAFNLLDNMDGAAGAVVTAIAVALAAAAGLEGQLLVAGLAACVAGTCCGFLVFNWHPARIFMGDAGSLFLGFLIATLALKLRFAISPPASLVALGLLVGAAGFDTALVVVSRLRDRKPFYVGGADHTSHRLLHLGFSTPQVALILGAASGATAALGVAIGRSVISPVAAAPVGAIALVLLVRLLQVERAGAHEEAAPGYEAATVELSGATG